MFIKKKLKCYNDRLNFSEGSDVNKASVSKQGIICHYKYILDKWLKFQRYVCNGCHDVLMMSVNINSIAIFNIYGLNYHCTVNGISKSKTINLLKNADLSEKKWNIIKYDFFII